MLCGEENMKYVWLREKVLPGFLYSGERFMILIWIGLSGSLDSHRTQEMMYFTIALKDTLCIKEDIWKLVYVEAIQL